MKRQWQILFATTVLACACTADPFASDGDTGPRDLNAPQDRSSDLTTPPDLAIADAATPCVAADGAVGVPLGDGGCRFPDANSPLVSFQAPAPDGVVIGNLLTARVTVIPRGRIVDTVVMAVGTLTAPLTLTSTANTYTGVLNVSNLPSGTLNVVATATDLDGNIGTAQVSVLRDAGPRITVLNPEPNTIFRTSTPLLFSVINPSGDARFDVDVTKTFAEIQQVRIPIQQLAGQSIPTWEGNIDANDTRFGQGLRGPQLLRVVAMSVLGAQSEATVQVTVDQTGPEISFDIPRAGTIVGGLLQLMVNVTDPAGIDDQSVVAVFAGDPQYSVTLRPVASAPGGAQQFIGQFDTRQLPRELVLPIISVRALDNVGNEGERSETIIIDNVAPGVDLDPAEDLRSLRSTDGVCSQRYDPVGSDATDDGDIVPQLLWLRARIQDRGNVATGQAAEFVALVRAGTPELYAIRAADAPLIVDTDGDGVCDDINPNLVPTTRITAPNQAIVVPMAAISVLGSPDFTPDLNPMAPPDTPCQSFGTSSDTPQRPICVVSPIIYDLGYTASGREPAIWSVPPVEASPALCQGLQFDTANSVPDGTVCVAVRAIDNVGNRNVSKPLRLCLDKQLSGTVCDSSVYQLHDAQPAPNSQNRPNCTGTIVNGQVDGTRPCTPGVRRNNTMIEPHFRASGEVVLFR